MAEINTGGNNSTQIDWSNAVGSFVSAGSGLLGSIISGVYNRKRQRESQEWAERMQDKTNQYNLPINQVARLKEAGLNPNLAFGSAASAMGSPVGSVPHYSEAPDYGGAIRQGINDYFSRRYERLQVLNNLREQNADIDKKETENETMHLLLDDYRALKRSDYALGQLKNMVDSTLYERKAGLETDYLSAKWLNEIDRFFAHVPEALRNHYQAQDELLRTRNSSEYQDYLTKTSKGRFERFYYDKNINPYETSTVAGAIRTIAGLMKFGWDWFDNPSGTPGFAPSSQPATPKKSKGTFLDRAYEKWPTPKHFIYDFGRQFARSFSWYKKHSSKW